MALTDQDVHVPTDYPMASPPAVGESFIDPVFGSTVTRLSDADAASATRFVPEYSQTSSYNLDDTYLILRTPLFRFSLHQPDGTFIRGMPAATREPRWSRITPKYCYYHDFTQIWRYDADADTSTEVGDLFGQTISFGKDQGDLSDDDRIVVVRDNRYVSIWDLVAGSQVPTTELDTAAAPISGASIDHGYISMAGDTFTVGYSPKGLNRGEGLEQYDVDAAFMTQLISDTPHASMGRETDGTPILFLTTSGAVPSVGCAGGMAKVSLDGNATLTCILNIPFGLGRHLSAIGGDGWCYLSSEQVPSPTAPPVPAQQDDLYNAGGDNDWHPLTDEIWRVHADGTFATPIIERLAHSGRRSTGYWMEPHANISISGKRLVFGSDMGQTIDVGEYADTYMMEIGAPMALTAEFRVYPRLTGEFQVGPKLSAEFKAYPRLSGITRIRAHSDES